MEPEIFTYRRVATQGCELIGPEGIIGWTVSPAWAALLVSLLNRDADGDGDGDNGDRPTAGRAGDDEVTARRAIEYLADHAPVVVCKFPTDDPPSAEVQGLVEPYLHSASVEIGDLLSRYTMRQLADDFLGLGKIDIPEEGGATRTSRHAQANDGLESANEQTTAKKEAGHRSTDPPGLGRGRCSST